MKRSTIHTLGMRRCSKQSQKLVGKRLSGDVIEWMTTVVWQEELGAMLKLLGSGSRCPGMFLAPTVAVQPPRRGVPEPG